eukprot:6196466-Pleurochrysis_carterae.AAC.1
MHNRRRRKNASCGGCICFDTSLESPLPCSTSASLLVLDVQPRSSPASHDFSQLRRFASPARQPPHSRSYATPGAARHTHAQTRRRNPAAAAASHASRLAEDARRREEHARAHTERTQRRHAQQLRRARAKRLGDGAQPLACETWV